MIHYIFLDMVSMIKYIPYGMLTGIPLVAVLLFMMAKVGKCKDRKPAALLPVVLFGFYFALMIVITFLSRESGSRDGMDLKLFATWGINARNNAYVVENVLLFIPYGFFGSMAFEKFRHFGTGLALGIATSLGIECMQLITKRGYFQTDDIWTNVLGTVIGLGAFRLLCCFQTNNSKADGLGKNGGIFGRIGAYFEKNSKVFGKVGAYFKKNDESFGKSDEIIGKNDEVIQEPEDAT